MIQWYPGHMAKAKRIVGKDLKLVDLVIELLDARIPGSSVNPDLNDLLVDQEKIIVLNKMDLANKQMTKDWIDYFKNENPTLAVNAIEKQGLGQLRHLLEVERDKINDKLAKKGRNERAVRVMIIGIPNVGKSALINALAGSKVANIGNKPGVTRGRQWINVGKKIKLLDTPGILWPSFSDEDTAYKLALTGAINKDVFDFEMAAYRLIKFINDINIKTLENAYQIEIDTEQPYDILEIIGKRRGCMMSGGKVDRNRAAELIINDYRNGNLGRLTLEKLSGTVGDL